MAKASVVSVSIIKSATYKFLVDEVAVAVFLADNINLNIVHTKQTPPIASSVGNVYAA